MGGNELTHSQVGSHFGSWSLNGKLLKLRCLKWAYMTHLSTTNTSCGWMKGRESKCQFDSRPLKVRNCFNFLTCRWRVTYSWKAFDKAYNFTSGLTLHKMLWASKVVRVPISWILGLSTWESWDKMTFGCNMYG
jgi:hypothetical protein